MPRKIQDILPPKTHTPQKKPKFSIKKEVKKKEKPIELLKKGRSEKEIDKKWLFIPALFVLVIIIGSRMSKAEIDIKPVTEVLNFETEIEIDTALQDPIFENKALPGYVFNIEETVSETFTATGKTLKKAEGVIRLYNAYTTKSEEWLEGTRFVSSEGKLFKSKDKISVPGAEIKDGKLVPKYVDVPVIAAEPGEEYNIGPSHFSIFVFRGTPRYTKFYGESFEPMRGGGEAPKVTEEDLEKAEESLIEKAKVQAERSLKEKIGEDFIFLNDVTESEIVEKSSEAKAGNETDKFNFQVKAKATTICLKKEHAEAFAEDFILSRLPANRLFYKKSLKIDYTPQVVDFDSGRVLVSLLISGRIYPDIDLQALKKTLVGRSAEETKVFLENQTEFSETRVKLQPFWVKRVPKNLDKIQINYPVIDNF